jgi:hypothetical protein
MVGIVVKMHDEENLHQVQIMSKLRVERDQTINKWICLIDNIEERLTDFAIELFEDEPDRFFL